MRRLAIPLLLTLFALAACDSSPSGNGPPAGPSITGSWQGEVVTEDITGAVDTVLIAMNLAEDQTMVSGDGTVTGRLGVIPFQISTGGSYVHPFLSLDMIYTSSMGSFPGALNANVSADRTMIRGTMTGPGFSGNAELDIVLTRMTP